MVGVIGLGFVGLTTAVCLADYHKVIGYDIDKEKSDCIKNGKVPFFEQGLEEKLRTNLGKTFFVGSFSEASREDVVFLCLPVKTKNKADDVKFLSEVIENVLGSHGISKVTIVLKCTILPGTCELVLEKLSEYTNFDLVVNPEFLAEGSAVDDCVKPSRVVLGSNSKEALEKVSEIYAPFNVPIYKTNFKTAEFTKYLSNCALATMISYSNEMAEVAEKIGGIDIPLAFKAFQEDKRFKNGEIKNFFYPGCGYGGWCLPKDTHAFFKEFMKQKDSKSACILRDVIFVNQMRIFSLVDKINMYKPEPKKIGVCGLSFKSDTSDIRNAVSTEVVRFLSNKNLILYDPLAMGEFKKIYPEFEYAESLDELIEKSDLIVVLNKDSAYLKIKNCGKPFIDGRYFL